MDRRITLAVTALAFVLIATGCAPEKPAETPLQEPAREATDVPGGAAGTMLAPGLYDLADGSSQAIGTLKWVDLEGGFWAVVGGTQAAGDEGTTVAVIANVEKDDPAYQALEGKPVSVTGTRAEGASIRQAGPEIEASSISALDDTPDPAQ